MMMGRASTERDNAVTLMMEAAAGGMFDAAEFQRMFFVAVQNMSVTEMNNMLKECTTYEDLMDLDVHM
jgi:hypothetical protein